MYKVCKIKIKNINLELIYHIFYRLNLNFYFSKLLDLLVKICFVFSFNSLLKCEGMEKNKTMDPRPIAFRQFLERKEGKCTGKE